jgi:hypothetical protein
MPILRSQGSPKRRQASWTPMVLLLALRKETMKINWKTIAFWVALFCFVYFAPTEGM